jgi:hypothetical protein
LVMSVIEKKSVFLWRFQKYKHALVTKCAYKSFSRITGFCREKSCLKSSFSWKHIDNVHFVTKASLYFWNHTKRLIFWHPTWHILRKKIWDPYYVKHSLTRLTRCTVHSASSWIFDLV